LAQISQEDDAVPYRQGREYFALGSFDLLDAFDQQIETSRRQMHRPGAAVIRVPFSSYPAPLHQSPKHLFEGTLVDPRRIHQVALRCAGFSVQRKQCSDLLAGYVIADRARENIDGSLMIASK
jgi:hypothetical protein